MKNGTSDSRKEWFAVGDYKKIPNEVGGMNTSLPEEVADKMKDLLEKYNAKKKTLDDILEFHVKFERIHPFQDGNGRTGRLILFRGCLINRLVPLIIMDETRMEYLDALASYRKGQGIDKLTLLFRKEQKSYEENADTLCENTGRCSIDEQIHP